MLLDRENLAGADDPPQFGTRALLNTSVGNYPLTVEGTIGDTYWCRARAMFVPNGALMGRHAREWLDNAVHLARVALFEQGGFVVLRSAC
jgi:hypothetical protein